MVDAAAWGVEPGYNDVRDDWQEAPPDTVDRILEALGATTERPPGLDGDEPVRVVRAGTDIRPEGLWTLRFEDGGVLRGNGGSLPPDLPLGYHDLELPQRGLVQRLIVVPRRCPRPPRGVRRWGLAAQVASLHRTGSPGIGDLGDLAALARWSAGRGASLLLCSPLHASLPGSPQQDSPYYPASRVFRNPLHIDVAAVPGASAVAAAGDAALVDRDAMWTAKEAALRTAFDAAPRDAAPTGLAARWAAFCALSSTFGRDRSLWPGATGTDPAAATRLVSSDPALAEEAAFHAWLQVELDRQLEVAASQGVDLVADLAVGCDPGGADPWLFPGAFVEGMRVGAPPDEFAPDGQDWGLPPFDPWALRAQRYEPFVAVLRASFRHAGAVRIDHVMGLFRLFWIPLGCSGREGAYVRYPWRDLLGLVALEAHRAGAWVVGEDLGTVDPAMREGLADHDVLSYRLLWFEDDAPTEFPEAALASVTTHDLPTVTGMWTGEDNEDLRAVGVPVVDDAVEGLVRRLDAATGCGRPAWAGGSGTVDPATVTAAACGAVASTPSVCVTVTMEDLLGVSLRPNVPGTTDERPNWRHRLPVPVDRLEGHPHVEAVLAAVVAERPPPT